MKTFKQFLKEDTGYLPPPSHSPAIVKQHQGDDPIGDLIRKYSTPSQHKDEIGELIRKLDNPIDHEKESKDFIERTFRLEGGLSKDKSDPGGTTKFGVSEKGTGLSKDEITNLTHEKAGELYKTRYYNEMIKHPKYHTLSKPSRAIVLDASVHHGPRFAKNLIDTVGDNPHELLNARQKDYDRLTATEQYGKYREGWKARLNKIRNEFGLHN